MGFPWALAAWSTLGGLTAYRTLVRSCRAIFEKGEITACPGAGCSSGLTVRSLAGTAKVYSVVTGTVTRTGAGFIELASALEPVVVRYEGTGLSPLVGAGGRVKLGQAVAMAASVTLSVASIDRDPSGSVALVPLEPATWLASRGLAAARSLAPNALWCAQGRKLVVPQSVGTCGVRLPEPASFALLPVSARLA